MKNIKERRGQITSSAFLRYRQTPMFLKRVNAHAIQRELSTSVLETFLSIPQLSENKNQKWTFFAFIFALRLKPLPD